MSFIEGFYSFNIEISNASNDFHGKTRIKVGRHLEEPLHHFYARIVAYMHSYVEGLELNCNHVHEEEPALYIRDALSQYKFWGEVGDPDQKKFMAGTRNHKGGVFRHYFYTPQQLSRFCSVLRGTKSNWIQPIHFYMLPAEILETLAQEERSQVRWSVTLVDNNAYLSTGTSDLAFTIEEVDVWREYQLSIGNA